MAIGNKGYFYMGYSRTPHEQPPWLTTVFSLTDCLGCINDLSSTTTRQTRPATMAICLLPLTNDHLIGGQHFFFLPKCCNELSLNAWLTRTYARNAIKTIKSYEWWRLLFLAIFYFLTELWKWHLTAARLSSHILYIHKHTLCYKN